MTLQHDEHGFLVGVPVDCEPGMARIRAEKIQRELDRWWEKRGHPWTLAELACGLRDGGIHLHPPSSVRLVGREQHRLSNDDQQALDAYTDAEKVLVSGGRFRHNLLIESALTVERLTRPKPASVLAALSHRETEDCKRIVLEYWHKNKAIYPSKNEAASAILEKKLVPLKYEAIRGYLKNQ